MFRHDGDLLAGDWFCADPETEILTAGGWRRYDQVQIGDLVASLDTDSGVAAWVPVQRMNVFDVVDEKMLRIHGKSLSALVTQGHRWPVRQRTRNGGVGFKWEVRTSSELTLESSVIRSARFATPGTKSVSDAFVEIVGWSWTEGTLRKAGGIHLSQSPTANPDKCRRIEDAMHEMYGPPTLTRGYPSSDPAWRAGTYTRTLDDGREETHRHWRLNAAAARAILAAAPDFVLDTGWLRQLTEDQLQILVKVSLLADGHERTRGGHDEKHLAQNRQDRADAFQVAVLMSGSAAAVRPRTFQYRGEPYSMWTVSILEKVTAKPLRQSTAEWETYTGVVWCPTVEHGTWLCRRDGLVHWTGNCGAGGSTQGIAAIPGVRPIHAANHWARAIESHAANFPDVDHWRGNIRDIDVTKLPHFDVFWASPECTTWSRAKGNRQDYAVTDVAIPGLEEPAPSEEVERSRALMEEVPLYLEAMVLRGKPVLAGVVENVVDIRDWTDWGRWRAQIESIGYRTRLIALNSMHAQSVRTARAPQSRDRLYLAYWHVGLGRNPDWDKWLRPVAWCPGCEAWVRAVQVFKDPTRDMGRYRSQYVYRCPQVSCRGQVVEPEFSPAYTAIDWTVKGERIGDRARPLAPKTLARIEAGIKKFARPITLEAAGNTFERRPGVRTWPTDGPLTTLTTTATKAVAVPPLLMPVEGRENVYARPVSGPHRTQSTRYDTALVTVPLLVPAGGTWNDTAAPVTDPMRTRSTRENEALVAVPIIGNHRGGPGDFRNADLTGVLPAVTASGNHLSLTVPPFIAELRGGNSYARPIAEALATVTASGNHHGLVVPPGMMMRNNGSKGDGGEHCTALDDAMRTLTTTGHQSLVTWGWDEWASLYAYDSPNALRSLLHALPTQTTVEGDALLQGAGLPAVEDCLFRMLEPHEILAGMAFAQDYIVLGNRRERVRQAGNAVTPPAAEVIVSALVEAITGEDVAA